MRKYLKPAMDMEAFDVEDIITVSETDFTHEGIGSQQGSGFESESGNGSAAAPIFVSFN